MAAWLHHLTLHFPIALSFALAAFGVFTLRRDEPVLWEVLLWASRFAFLMTTLAAISGLVAAQDYWTEDGPYVLIHHRNLGILAWASSAAAFGGLEWGRIDKEKRAMQFGALCWIAVAAAMIGAGHWGGYGIHHDIIPWAEVDPGLQR